MSNPPSATYGPSLRAGAVGNLAVFNTNVATARARSPTFSLRATLHKQYAQPAPSNQGIDRFRLTNNLPSHVLDRHATDAAIRHYGSDGSSTLYSPEDRFKSFSIKPQAAILLVARFMTGSTDDGSPILGNPVIIVGQAPTVPLLGATVDAAEVWPDADRLLPLNIQKPTAPFHLLGFSVDPQSRKANSASMAGEHPDYLHDIVYTFQGLRASQVLWSYADHTPIDHEHVFFPDALPLSPLDYAGTGSSSCCCSGRSASCDSSASFLFGSWSSNPSWSNVCSFDW